MRHTYLDPGSISNQMYRYSGICLCFGAFPFNAYVINRSPLTAQHQKHPCSDNHHFFASSLSPLQYRAFDIVRTLQKHPLIVNHLIDQIPTTVHDQDSAPSQQRSSPGCRQHRSPRGKVLATAANGKMTGSVNTLRAKTIWRRKHHCNFSILGRDSRKLPAGLRLLLFNAAFPMRLSRILSLACLCHQFGYWSYFTFVDCS